MKIETKYNTGDKVYVLDCGSTIQEIRISRPTIETFTDGSYRVSYEWYDEGTRSSSKVFDTKEEAGKEWLKLQGLDCGLKG